MERTSILIIEDNPNTRRFLEAMLKKDFDILTAENAIIGMELARKDVPDLIILDIVLPMLDGFDACKLLKEDDKTRHIPIIFLSVKNSISDIKRGLSVGADDFLPKPFDFKELLARINTRIRTKTEAGANLPIQIGDLKIDPTNREVFFENKKINLTLTEFDILRHLAKNSGKVVSREEIFKEAWRDKTPNATNRTIDVHIRALRKKIPSLSKHITSVYGVGYKYDK